MLSGCGPRSARLPDPKPAVSAQSAPVSVVPVAPTGAGSVVREQRSVQQLEAEHAEKFKNLSPF
jgi:hypothetical protein